MVHRFPCGALQCHASPSARQCPCRKPSRPLPSPRIAPRNGARNVSSTCSNPLPHREKRVAKTARQIARSTTRSVSFLQCPRQCQGCSFAFVIAHQLEHFTHGNFEPDKNRARHNRVADVEFSEVWNLKNLADIRVVDSVTSVDLQAKFRSPHSGGAKPMQLRLACFSNSVGERGGVQFH